jgi:hypothetical protein
MNNYYLFQTKFEKAMRGFATQRAHSDCLSEERT